MYFKFVVAASGTFVDRSANMLRTFLKAALLDVVRGALSETLLKSTVWTN